MFIVISTDAITYTVLTTDRQTIIQYIILSCFQIKP